MAPPPLQLASYLYLSTPTAGSCVAAGFTGCCVDGADPGCVTAVCACDALCHDNGDCCEDIDETCPL